MSTNNKILLAEDDPTLASAIQYFLRQREWEVTHYISAEDSWRHFMKDNFSFCLLDVTLAGKKNGFDLARMIRSKNKRIPIFLLSSNSDDDHRIEGLETGADCFLPKPFSFQELYSRMKVFLKYAGNPGHSDQNIFKLGDYEFNYQKATLGDFNYTHLLTKREADLLQYLCVSAGQMVRREQILLDLWGKDDHFLGRSLDVFIASLRKYLNTQSNIEIQTIHGVGFRLLDKADFAEVDILKKSGK